MNPCGLTEEEAGQRRARYGPNTLPEVAEHWLRQMGKRFWGPIPWILEATVVLQLFLGEHLEAGVISALLVANASIGLVQERRARSSLQVLKQQLQTITRVHRSGVWVSRPAAELVPDDLIELEQGGLIPADVLIVEGRVDVDQSALTGESVPVSHAIGETAASGGIVRAGRAQAKVTTTGAATEWGRTAALVRAAEPVNHQERETTRVVRDLFVVNAALITIILGVAHHRHLGLAETLPLVLTLLLAAIPVALPAMFTLAGALGAVELSRRGAIVTRLSALHDLASMTVLCTDKTGTLTRNEATIQRSLTAAGVSLKELLEAAVLASDALSGDPIERTVAGSAVAPNGWTRNSFKPFEAEAHWSDATWSDLNGAPHRFVKGAPDAIARLTTEPNSDLDVHAQSLAADGLRVIAVASGAVGKLSYVGMIGLADEVRAESKAVVATLQSQGVRVVMLTGDTLGAATIVAQQVGLVGEVYSAEHLRRPNPEEVAHAAGFAGVQPKDKIWLVRALQSRGAVVGMSGDGVNDAPALRQAEAGVAVSNATDVARAAAAIVLTTPGLQALPAAVEVSRRVFQRVVAYTLNSLSKKIELMLLLSASFLFFGTRAMTPLLMVLIMFLNDFVTMALTSDAMTVAPRATPWKGTHVMLAAVAFGLFRLAFSLSALVLVPSWAHLDPGQARLMTFLVVVMSSQAGAYSLRERGAFWRSKPGLGLVVSTLFAVAMAIALTWSGVLGASLPLSVAGGVTLAAFAFYGLVDPMKALLFRSLDFR